MSSSAIPMARLGGRAFNHNSSADAEAEYDRLRDLARAEGDRKKDCFDRAHEAYERGDGAGAKELSDQGKHHQRKQAEFNKQASDFIFRENNAPGRVAGDTIDLHGQFVEEAEDILEGRIRYAQSTGQTHLHVVVGRGNHSTGHVQKLKPRVERLCRELGFQYATEENEGRIYVDLRGGRVDGAAPLPAQPGGGYPQPQNAGYASQQQPQYQQQPPPQKQNKTDSSGCCGPWGWSVFGDICGMFCRC